LALANGTFEDSEEEIPDIVEEFFSATGQSFSTDGKSTVPKQDLVDRLAERVGHTSNSAK